MSVADSYKYAPPHVLSFRIWLFEVKRHEEIKELRPKYLTLCIPPFKVTVTQGHQNQHGSIRHLRLPINVP